MRPMHAFVSSHLSFLATLLLLGGTASAQGWEVEEIVNNTGH